MIKELKLINFRNFKEIVLKDFQGENFIVGENGRGKTNTLEAITILGNNSLLRLSLNNLVKNGEDYFFIEVKDDKENSFSLYYSVKDNKKNLMVNGKKISAKGFFEKSYNCVVFSPSNMNMLYLGPTLRRDFIDDTLKSSFEEYDNLLKEYKKILKSRNSILKAIHENKAPSSEITFWDKKFVEKAIQIYEYRFLLIDFFKNSIGNIRECISYEGEIFEFEYISKIDRKNIKDSINSYLKENFQRDILLQKTHIGPHIDDFEVKIDGKNVILFSSRGEIKSVIIYLKLLEGLFIEKKTGKKPIMVIDDLISELDDIHKSLLLEKIKYYQSFISSIKEESGKNYIKI